MSATRGGVSAAGRVQLGTYVDQSLWRTLKHIAIEEDTTLSLVLENVIGTYDGSSEQQLDERRSKKNRIQCGVRISVDLKDKLVRIADANGNRLDFEVEQAIDAYIERWKANHGSIIL